MFKNKPYNDLSAYLKSSYGEKVYKVSLDGGFSCPNRDGFLDSRGCIFCSAGGSGEFATPIIRDLFYSSLEDFHHHVHNQIDIATKKFTCKKIGNKFIAYFQAYTGTYAPADYLLSLYECALNHPLIIGLSIATRPDCLSNEVLNVFKILKDKYSDKFIWIELGLQTIHERTAKYIRRGYPLSKFDQALESLQKLDIPVIVHIILGLPGESNTDVLDTINYLNKKNIFGIKLQLLHILKGTDLADDYRSNKFEAMTKDEYLALLIECIEHLDPSIILHRVTGDGPKDLLIAPTWSINKRDVLNSLHKAMKNGGNYQGRQFLSCP